MSSIPSLNEEQTEVKGSPAVLPGVSRETAFLMASVVGAFIFRVLMIPREVAVTSDGAYYATLGQKLLSSDFSSGISGYWPPFYPFLIGLFSFFSPDPEFAGRLVSLIAGSVLVLPVYHLIKDFYGSKTAALGVILTVFHPSLAEASGWVLTESLYTLLLTVGLLVSWRSLQSGKPMLFFTSGILFGLAYLTKPEAVAYLGPLFALTVITKFFRREFPLRALGKGYLLVLVGFLVFLVPYVVAVHQKTGHWTLTDKFQGNVSAVDSDTHPLALNKDRTGTLKDRWMGSMYDVGDQVESEPGKPISPWARDSTFNVLGLFQETFAGLKHEIRVYIPEMLRYPLVIAVIVGFFYRPLTRSRIEKEIFLSTFVLSTLLIYAMSTIELRYLFVMIPMLICWASNGIAELSEWLSRTTSNLFGKARKLPPLAFQLLLILAVLGLFLETAVYGNAVIDLDGSLEDKQAGIWIKDHKTSPSLIMAPSPVAAFYANAPSIYLPNEELSVVLDYARSKKVDYIYMNRGSMDGTPKLEIPDTESLPKALKLVYHEKLTNGNELLIFQLLQK